MQRIIVLVFVFLSIQASPSRANGLEACVDCVAHSNKADEKKLNFSGQTLKRFENWAVNTTSDVFTDEVHTIARAPSPTLVKCRWGTKTPSLVLECKKGEVIARFQTHCRISTSAYDDYGDVTFRVDARPTQTMRFSESEDNRSMGLWNTQDSKPFIKSLLGGEKLVARIKPYSDEPFIAEFETKGIDAAIKPIQQACGWE